MPRGFRSMRSHRGAHRGFSSPRGFAMPRQPPPPPPLFATFPENRSPRRHSLHPPPRRHPVPPLLQDELLYDDVAPPHRHYPDHRNPDFLDDPDPDFYDDVLPPVRGRPEYHRRQYDDYNDYPHPPRLLDWEDDFRPRRPPRPPPEYDDWVPDRRPYYDDEPPFHRPGPPQRHFNDSFGHKRDVTYKGRKEADLYVEYLRKKLDKHMINGDDTKTGEKRKQPNEWMENANMSFECEGDADFTDDLCWLRSSPKRRKLGVTREKSIPVGVVAPTTATKTNHFLDDYSTEKVLLATLADFVRDLKEQVEGFIKFNRNVEQKSRHFIESCAKTNDVEVRYEHEKCMLDEDGLKVFSCKLFIETIFLAEGESQMSSSAATVQACYLTIDTFLNHSIHDIITDFERQPPSKERGITVEIVDDSAKGSKIISNEDEGAIVTSAIANGVNGEHSLDASQKHHSLMLQVASFANKVLESSLKGKNAIARLEVGTRDPKSSSSLRYVYKRSTDDKGLVTNMCKVVVHGIILGESSESAKKDSKLSACKKTIDTLMTNSVDWIIQDFPRFHEVVGEGTFVEEVHSNIESNIGQIASRREDMSPIDLSNMIIYAPESADKDGSAANLLYRSAEFTNLLLEYHYEPGNSKLNTINCKVFLEKRRVGEGSGFSRVEAKDNAAKLALTRLRRTNYTLRRKNAEDFVTQAKAFPTRRASSKPDLERLMFKKLGYPNGIITGTTRSGTVELFEPRDFWSSNDKFHDLQDFQCRINHIFAAFLKHSSIDDLLFITTFSEAEHNIILNEAKRNNFSIFQSSSTSKSKKTQLNVKYELISIKRTRMELMKTLEKNGGESYKYKVEVPSNPVKKEAQAVIEQKDKIKTVDETDSDQVLLQQTAY